MEMLNRSAVLLKPRRPYLEWAKLDDAEGLADGVFETMREEPVVYLLPDYDDEYERDELLERCWPVLFEVMLAAWTENEALWPEERAFELFQEWFEVQMSSIVEDLLADEPLEYFE